MKDSDMYNKYSEDRLFLIGNGPSLKETPLDALEGEYSLAMNKINRIYNQTNWRPSIYFFTQAKLNSNKQENVEEHINMGIPCFINSKHEEIFGKEDNIYYINANELKYNPTKSRNNLHELDITKINNMPIEDLLDFWSDDIFNVVNTYHSMYGAFQVANYLGFSEIYLIGCDLGLTDYTPHMIFKTDIDPLDYNSIGTFVKDSYNQNILIKSTVNALAFKLYFITSGKTRSYIHRLLNNSDEINHFDDGYQTKPKNSSNDGYEITKSHVVAKRILDHKGVQVYNATLGGELDVYQRVDFRELI